MRGAVRPRVLAVAVAAAACLVALGGIATVAVWGFRHGTAHSSTSVAGWLLLVWVGVAIGVVLVVVVALAGARALRLPLVELSRAARQLQVERLPTALREIEAGVEPAPRPAISAPLELEGVAGALENLERFVHYHAKRAQRADRDLGRLLTGAADRVAARARIAEGIDLDPPGAMASGLRRDAGALRALLPDSVVAATERSGGEAAPASGPGPSISETVDAVARTTLRPTAVVVGELEPAFVAGSGTDVVLVVLGEVVDAAIGGDGDVVVWGSVQPEGYHLVVDAAIGDRGAELAHLAVALRERDPVRLPFGLRAAVEAGRHARILVWLTTVGADAQWHVLVPPRSFMTAKVVAPEQPRPVAEPVGEPAGVPEVAHPAPVTVAATAKGSGALADLARLAAARRLGEALANLFGRLEIALEQRPPNGPGLEEEERIALLVDGTRLVGKLQEAQMCSSRALRSLLRAIDVAVGADRSVPLAGSARDQATLPYEALAEVGERIAEAADVFPAPPSG